MKKVIIIVSILAVGLFTALHFVNCGGGASAVTTNCGVTLTSLDFPSVGVCANCDVSVTSDTLKNFLATITSMTLLHKTFAGDSTIPFICGKQGVWDPSDSDAFDDATRTLNMTGSLYGVGGVLELPNLFICNLGFGFDPGSASEGLHGATVWRGEITFTDGTTIYRARLRFTVTGSGVDQTFTDLGINITDIILQDGNGNQLDTASDVRDLFAADPTNITLKVIANSTTYLTATGGMICVETL